ncbi:hypothetical protein GSH04_34500 [Burkholderia pseudomallei]|nr:hypothetical protein [Burkholderia pseudomallei]MBM5633409.1 hypothetical protein [Burkholderia pseudomallei]MBM5663228.1 hypothetical protein [Burkholderia pseudomallei]
MFRVAKGIRKSNARGVFRFCRVSAGVGSSGRCSPARCVRGRVGRRK